MSSKMAYWFVFHNERLLIVNDLSTNHLLTIENITTIKSFFVQEHLLGTFAEFDVFCAEISENTPLTELFTTIPFRKALELLGNEWYTIAAKAYEIITWDKNHHYCGRCGHETILATAKFERHCPHCQLIFYPRISPSIIVLIQKGDEILMARGHHFMPGVYGLIAGFVEAGERVEEAVHREVYEETRLSIKNLVYFGSQAWPFPDSLMLAFTAEYASGDIIIDPHEIAEANWYRYDALPGNPSSSISIARKLIDHFVAQKTKGIDHGKL